jgi:multidrug efflux pump subunit AcrA (membrane-fusion protein)
MSSNKMVGFYLILILALLFSACSSVGNALPTPTPLPPLLSYEKTLYPVEQGPIAEVFKLEGEVTPATQDPLFFRSSGFINRVPFKGGDTVKKGDIIAELQIDDLLNQLQQAEIDLEVARAALANQVKAREYAIARAEHNVKLAELNLEQAKSSGGSKNQIAMAEENLALAQLSLQEASEEINSFEEQAVRRTELAVERLKSQIAERQIVAPYDGILFRHAIRPGDAVEAFEPLFTIGDPSELVIRTNRTIDLQGKLRENTEAYMRLDPDSEQKFSLRYLPNFAPVSSSLEETKGGQTITDYYYFEMSERPDASLIPVGQSVEVEIVTGRNENAMTLPPAVIREFGGLKFVIIREGDTQRRVEVRVGLATNEKVEVIGDLKEGDMVVGP